MFKILRLKNIRGQAMIEFALVMPILMLVIFVFLQLGILLNNYLILNHLAREGARYAAVNSDYDSDTTTYVQSIIPSMINQNNLTIAVSPSEGDSTRTRGNPITVTLTYDFSDNIFLPTTFFNFQLPTTFPTISAAMVIE